MAPVTVSPASSGASAKAFLNHVDWKAAGRLNGMLPRGKPEHSMVVHTHKQPASLPSFLRNQLSLPSLASAASFPCPWLPPWFKAPVSRLTQALTMIYHFLTYTFSCSAAEETP